jgi:predicted transcriptional regulator
MRANTQQIFERLSKGGFLSVDSNDQEVKHLYDDIEENYADYETYFSELGLQLESGDGYYFFARTQEGKQTIEQKLQSFAQWIDILDFLKTYNITFSTGFQFRGTHILERISLDVELRDKARKLFRKQNTNQEIVEKLIGELTSMGFAELISEEDGTYKVTSAFRYAEDMVNLITVYNEEELPEI